MNFQLEFSPHSFDPCSSVSDGESTSSNHQDKLALGSMLSDFEPRHFAPDDKAAYEDEARDTNIFVGLEDLGLLNFSGTPMMTKGAPEAYSSCEPHLVVGDYSCDHTNTTESTPAFDDRYPILPGSQSLLAAFNGHHTIGLSPDACPVIVPSSQPKASMMPSHQSGKWGSMFQELMLWSQKHGHCQVRHNDPADARLACWLKRQKYQYKLKMLNKPSSLSDDRQRILEAAGVVWDSHEAAWLEKYYTLRCWYERNGHTCVPSNDPDRSLAVWVKTQRRHAKQLRRGKSSPLSKRRLELLQELSFSWNPRNLVV